MGLWTSSLRQYHDCMSLSVSVSPYPTHNPPVSLSLVPRFISHTSVPFVSYTRQVSTGTNSEWCTGAPENYGGAASFSLGSARAEVKDDQVTCTIDSLILQQPRFLQQQK